jgi:hypothetical protein
LRASAIALNDRANCHVVRGRNIEPSRNLRNIIRGKRNSWNQVNEENTIAGVSLCPEPAYTRKATTEASVGVDRPNAMFAARINSPVRT